MSTSPAVSAVREKVTRERTIPPEELARESSARMPDTFEYIERMKQEDWNEHIAYLYREEPKATTYNGAPPAYLDKYVGTIEVRPGYTIPMDDAGSIQQAIKEKFGGRVFRLILKKGKERISECKFTNELPPKYPDQQQPFQPANAAPPNGVPHQSSDTVAMRAIDTVANQNPQLISIAVDAVRSAADIISKHNAPPASTDSELDRAFKQAMINKLLAEPPKPQDPFDMFVKFKQLMREDVPAAPAQSNSMNQILDRVLGAAVDKILNPAPAITTGRTTLLDLGREFVPVLGTVMHEYRLSREADARIMDLQRVPGGASAQPPIDIAPAAPAAAPAPNPPPAAATPAEAPPMNLSFPQIEAHIAKIVKNVDYPVDEAVDRVLSFLYDTDPRLVGALLNPPSIDQRLKPGKDGLIMLFQFEPPLQPCLANLPRLSEFIDKFIVAGTEAEAAEERLRQAAPATAAAQPTPKG